MPSEPSRERLPFEPRQKKKKSSKVQPLSQPGVKKGENPQPSLNAIPEVVSKRMVRRMALFCGVPTALGMSSFFIFYWIVSHDWLEIPTYAVMAVSLTLFLLGILGLSYGIFSASWEEEAGSWSGWKEFRVNLGRTTSAWRTAKKEAKEN